MEITEENIQKFIKKLEIKPGTKNLIVVSSESGLKRENLRHLGNLIDKALDTKCVILMVKGPVHTVKLLELK